MINRAFCNCTRIRFALLALGCDIPLISPRPNGTSFPTVSPKQRPLVGPENTRTWKSTMGFFTSPRLVASGAIYRRTCRPGARSTTTTALGPNALCCHRSILICASKSAWKQVENGNRLRPLSTVKPLKAVRLATSAAMMPARRSTDAIV
jgi:hypothetical protein